MIEGKKISELIPANVINDTCCFPVLSKGATRKITFAVLLENIINNLQLPETQEIKQLKSEVEKMNTSIELTDKQVESVINQVNGLQKDVDSQDDVIIKYTRIVEELKELYEQATITGGLVDDELDSESTNPVQNKVIKNDSTLHLIGLLSDGGVHSHNKYMKELIPILKAKGIKVCTFDSPVIELSSKYSSPLNIIESAGTLSPCSNITISPVTNSLDASLPSFNSLYIISNTSLISSFLFKVVSIFCLPAGDSLIVDTSISPYIVNA